MHHWLRFVTDPGWLQWCPPLYSRSGLLLDAVAEDLWKSVDSAFVDVERLQRPVDSRLVLNRLEFLLLLLANAGADEHALLDQCIQSALAFIGANFAQGWRGANLALH